MEEKVEQVLKPDRMLGDEWENWTGNLDESIQYRETSSLFALFAGFALVVILSVCAFVLYMIDPRLKEFHPFVLYGVRVMTYLFIAAAALWSVLIAASVYTGRNFIFGSRMGQVVASRILPIALFIAKRLGISRDRLGNSFVSFSNAIVTAAQKPVRGKTIILLPRCLRADLKSEIKEIADRAGVLVFTATGGGQARKVIKEQRPRAVIGVACERDLMSGIHDVVPLIPTIGVTNKRPEGPCKNTVIELDDLKKAIVTFTGVPLDD